MVSQPMEPQPMEPLKRLTNKFIELVNDEVYKRNERVVEALTSLIVE